MKKKKHPLIYKAINIASEKRDKRIKNIDIARDIYKYRYHESIIPDTVAANSAIHSIATSLGKIINMEQKLSDQFANEIGYVLGVNPKWLLGESEFMYGTWKEVEKYLKTKDELLYQGIKLILQSNNYLINKSKYKIIKNDEIEISESNDDSFSTHEADNNSCYEIEDINNHNHYIVTSKDIERLAKYFIANLETEMIKKEVFDNPVEFYLKNNSNN